MTGRSLDLRRLLGAGLVLAVVLGALIAGRRDGQRIAGTAATAPTVGVPAVGDCVAALVGPVAPGSSAPVSSASGPSASEPSVSGPPAPVSSASGPSASEPSVSGPSAAAGDVGDRSGRAGDGAGAAGGAGVGGAAGQDAVAVVDESAVVFGRCAGTHAGEVAAFRRDAPGTDPAARTGAAAAWCGEVAESYREHLRWQVSAAAGAWAPVQVQRFLAVIGRPGTDGWAVCAVLAPGLEQYRGSYLDSMADRAAPAPFGFCRSAVAAHRRVSCGEPHDEQVFGTARAGSSPTPDSCRALVQRLTAMPDPTGDARLVVGVDGSGSGACRARVVGPQRLTATLLGLGDAPLPLGPG